MPGGVWLWWDEHLQPHSIPTVCGAPQTLPGLLWAGQGRRCGTLLCALLWFSCSFLVENAGQVIFGKPQQLPAAEPQLTTSQSHHPHSHVCLKRKKRFFSPLCCYVTAPNKQEGDPAKVPNLPRPSQGWEDLPVGALGLGVLWGPAWPCSPALHCKQTKNSHGMLLTLCWVSRDSLVHLPSPKWPQFQYPASAPAFAAFFFPSWLCLVLTDCQQSCSCALQPPKF